MKPNNISNTEYLLRELLKQVNKISCQVCAGSSSSGSKSMDGEWSLDSSNVPVWVVTMENNTVVYYNYPGGTITAPSFPLKPTQTQDFEIKYNQICVSGATWMRVEVWDNSTGTPSPSGVVRFYDENDVLQVSPPISYVLGNCNALSIPGIELIQNVGDGTYTSPFNANSVRVNYYPALGNNTPIIVTMTGTGIYGNAQFQVFPNMVDEPKSFDSAVITGVVITGAVGSTVSIEFISK